MRIVIALAFLIYVVAAEYCDHTSDCTLTKCGTNFRLNCYRDNVCTCLATSTDSKYTCSTGMADECEKRLGQCDHGDHHWHCSDNKCQCRYFG